MRYQPDRARDGAAFRDESGLLIAPDIGFCAHPARIKVSAIHRAVHNDMMDLLLQEVILFLLRKPRPYPLVIPSYRMKQALSR